MSQSQSTDKPLMTSLGASPMEKKQKPTRQEIGIVVVFFLLLFGLNTLRVYVVLPWEGHLSDVLATIVELVVKGGIWVGLPFLFIRYVEKQSFLAILLLRRNVGKGVLVGLLASLFFVVQFVLNLVPGRHIQVSDTSLNGITGIVLAGIIEEIPFRGYLLQKFQGWMDTIVASLLNAVLFVLMHIPLWLTMGKNVQSIGGGGFYLFLIALLFCFAVRWSQSLWSSIILHTVHNLAQLFI